MIATKALAILTAADKIATPAHLQLRVALHVVGSAATDAMAPQARRPLLVALTSVANIGASLFSDGSTQGKGALSSGTLTITVHTAQTVLAGTQCAFSFTITNPSAEQNATSSRRRP